MRREYRQAIIGKTSSDSKRKGAIEPGHDMFGLDPKTAAMDVQSCIDDQQITVYNIREMSHADSQYKPYTVYYRGHPDKILVTWDVSLF